MDKLSLEQRVSRLEGALGWASEYEKYTKLRFLISFSLALAALVLCYKGLQLPNHRYQIILGILTAALAYHRGWFLLPTKWYEWVLALVDAALLSLLFRLVIGTGTRLPLFWLQYPTIASDPANKSKWIPSWNFSWQPSSFAEWSVDFTVVQTFLLVVTLVGALFRFQPFVSITAVLLVLSSIPAMAEFDWNWVFPALLVSGLAFYVQLPSSRVGH